MSVKIPQKFNRHTTAHGKTSQVFGLSLLCLYQDTNSPTLPRDASLNWAIAWHYFPFQIGGICKHSIGKNLPITFSLRSSGCCHYLNHGRCTRCQVPPSNRWTRHYKWFMFKTNDPLKHSCLHPFPANIPYILPHINLKMKLSPEWGLRSQGGEWWASFNRAQAKLPGFWNSLLPQTKGKSKSRKGYISCLFSRELAPDLGKD